MSKEQPSNAPPLPELQLFGVANPCKYMLRGKSIKGVYHLALEVTDHTNEGTYASTFPLDSLTKYWDEELDIAPNDGPVTLKWLKTAFDDSGGNAVRNFKLVPGQSPQLEALYQPILDDETSTETISIPPKEYPLLGNLSDKLATVIRASIFDACYNNRVATKAKLAACREQKKKLAAAVEAVDELREDGNTRVEQVIAMVRKLREGLNAVESDEEEKEEEKKTGGAEDKPPSAEKPLPATTSRTGTAGRGKPPPRRPQHRFGNAGKRLKPGEKVLGIKS